MFIDVDPESPRELTATVDATGTGIGTVCVEVVDPRAYFPIARSCSEAGAPSVTADVPSDRVVQVRAWFEAVRLPPPAETTVGAGHALIHSIAYTLSG